MGAVPESQVTAFIDKITKGMPGPASVGDMLKEAEAALAEGDHQTAASIYAEVLQDDATNIAALAGLARCYIETGATEQAKQTLANDSGSQAHGAGGQGGAGGDRSCRAGAIGRPDHRTGTERSRRTRSIIRRGSILRWR